MTKDIIIAMHRNVDFIGRLKIYLPEAYTIIEKGHIDLLSHESRINRVVCVVLYIEHSIIPEESHFEKFKNGFPNIPCVAVVVPRSLELARHCGEMGIESVLPYEEIDRIGNEIERVCIEKNNKVYLSELLIDKDHPAYSKVLKKALAIMEQDYVKILHVSEISNLMEISHCSLSREFAKYNLSGPKKILMSLKVHQAIKLMRNNGLNIKEISSLSGFTDENRISECFHKMFGMPPGEYRLKNISYSS